MKNEAAIAEQKGTEKKTRVLLVDDEEHIQLLYGEELKEIGYDVVVTDTGYRLVRKLCPYCKEPDQVTQLESLGLPFGVGDYPDEGFSFYKIGAGCHKCFDRGVRNRGIVIELLRFSSAVKESIMTEKTETEIEQAAYDDKVFIPMIMDSMRLLYAREVAISSVKEVVPPLRINIEKQRHKLTKK